MGLPEDDRGDGDSGGRPVLLLAGLADLALSTCGSALKAAHGLLGRSDLGSLAAQGSRDLQARGRLALDRLGTDRLGTDRLGTDRLSVDLFNAGGEAHMEGLARHAQRRAAADAATADASSTDAAAGGTGA
ncbi:hypothetical protein ACFUN8_15560 [Streptomyces sp. NPDC057307]|uniref:hypothetical protein n=1 Tax=Streptomyces sp. NPDC057307 TaxID=3346096 RepID=UPI003635A7ED